MGNVYFIQALSGGPIKVGKSSSERGINARLRTFQIGNPEKLIIRHTIVTPEEDFLEASIHSRFAQDRIRGEWFQPVSDLCRLCSAVRGEMKRGEMERRLSAAYAAGFRAALRGDSEPGNDLLTRLRLDRDKVPFDFDTAA